MTDLYLVAGDLETLYERVGYVVEDLGPVVVEEVGSYIHGGMPGGQSAEDANTGAFQSIANSAGVN